MFDWAYAVYPESAVWERMTYSNYLVRKLKKALIKRYIKRPVVVIGQTETICNRLKRCYGLTELETIPSAVALENMEAKEKFDFNLPEDKFKLLYPSSFAPHKNLDILIPVAQKIKEASYPYLIIITIEEKNNKSARNFLNKIKDRQLDSVILNVGHIDMGNIPSLYEQSDALLMPTLLESYGLPYVEAMYHGKSVLSSDIDFAHDVCGDAAFYFDPFDENSIIKAINEAYSNPDDRAVRIKAGKSKIKQLLTWEKVFERYQELLDLNIKKVDEVI
jgi:glycosyltransferase involved in cell wall biosynthesis